MRNDTSHVRDIYERFAPGYDHAIDFSELLLFGDGREWVCSRASGEVLEIAVGTGRNLPYYSGDVRLTGIELSPAMLETARRRAHELEREADLRLGDARELPYPDDAFDATYLVATLGEVPDQQRALKELHCVLKPDGRLVVGECLPAPHMVRFGTLCARAEAAGLVFERRLGDAPGCFTSFRLGLG